MPILGYTEIERFICPKCNQTALAVKSDTFRSRRSVQRRNCEDIARFDSIVPEP